MRCLRYLRRRSGLQLGGRVYQGKLDIAALRAISGQIEAHLAIFCEDSFASSWLKAVLRTQSDVAQEGVEIHEMFGDGTAVKINKNHNDDPSAKCPSVCYIDGDSLQTDSVADRVIRLPGDSPEAFVFDKTVDEAGKLGGVLAVRLLQPFAAADSVIAKLKEIRLTNHDPHLLFSQVGFALGLIPESTVREAFLATWAEAFPDQAAVILEPVETLLPRIKTQKPGGPPSLLWERLRSLMPLCQFAHNRQCTHRRRMSDCGEVGPSFLQNEAFQQLRSVENRSW